MTIPITRHPRGDFAPPALNHQRSRDAAAAASDLLGAQGSAEESELESTFKQFVGETFFGQLIKSMRSTVGKPAYLHGGRAEEIFQGQLDQKLAETMTAASADTIADPMFELFNLQEPR